MTKKQLGLKHEVLFQLLLHGAVFMFYAIDRRSPTIEGYEGVFFLNYALTAFIVNHVLLPRFLYPKAYLTFILGAVLLLFSAVIVEEFVLENIYFPDTRGRVFSGFFYALLDILPVCVALIGGKFAWDALIKQQEVELLQATIKESELLHLKSQINPHFLFNNLNNLYAYAIEESPRTPEIILELSSVLRYMLYDCKAQYVPLDKEIQHLAHFINISKLQIEHRGVVTFDVSAPYAFSIAPLILIVFVENAFKHSTASQTDAIHIEVAIQVDAAGQLNFTCRNSFERASNTQDLSGGIGLENVQKRLQLLYKDAYQLHINSTDHYYEVALQLQLD